MADHAPFVGWDPLRQNGQSPFWLKELSRQILLYILFHVFLSVPRKAMSFPLQKLLDEVELPSDVRSRLGTLLHGCGFREAIDAAMLDDDLISSIAGTDVALRPFLAHLCTSACPLIDGWAKGVPKFGLGRRGEGGAPGGPHVACAAPAAVESHGPRAIPAAAPEGVEPVEGTKGHARASRLLRGFTKKILNKNPRPTPPRPRTSMAEIEARRIEGAKQNIHGVLVTTSPRVGAWQVSQWWKTILFLQMVLMVPTRLMVEMPQMTTTMVEMR